MSLSPNFNYDAASGRVSWVNLTDSVRIVAQRLLVDAEGVAAFYAVPVLSAAEAEPVETVASPAPVIMPSGAPGRPTSMHLISGEMKKRAAAGELIHSLRAEAKALQVWLGAAWPDATPPTVKTIENALRDTYRGLKAPI